EGGVTVGWKVPVRTELGEPIAWQSGPGLDAGGASYLLCRCGGSASKPFCDGTHSRNGFDGTETADTDPRSARVKTYEGTGIVVQDDRSICEHAGFCGNRITNVWKMVADTADTRVRAQVVAMVERCPSGALTYALAPGAPDVEPDLAPKVNVVADGPLWLTGAIPVESSRGGTLETRNRVTLCRCGGSANKPHCDGTHKKLGFSHRPEE
ncbi:MAG: CDGSH iron-sulfur domain-containing protein, partial [Acidimicrobiia bacterium]